MKEWTGKSLFFKVFACFLAVMVLFSLVWTIALSLFKQTMIRERERESQAALFHASERFDGHLERIESFLFELSENPDLVGFDRQLSTRPADEIDYLPARGVIRSLQSYVYQPQNALLAVIVHFRSASLALSHKGSADARLLFDRLYASPDYSFDDWRSRLSGGRNFELLPAGTFVVDGRTRTALPVVFRQPASNYQMIALLDMEKIDEETVGLAEPGEWIVMARDGTELYQSGSLTAAAPPRMETGQGIARRAGNHYIYKKNAAGLTYVFVVPSSWMTKGAGSLSRLLLLILAGALAIGLAAAYAVSERIRKPVKNLLATVLSLQPAPPPGGSFKEFGVIHEKVNDLLGEKARISEQLRSRDSALKSYGYLNRLKNIPGDALEWRELPARDPGFIVALFTVRFGSPGAAELPEEARGLAVRRLLARLRDHVAGRFPSAHTFQIESDRVVTVFAGGEREAVVSHLRALKEPLDREAHVRSVTIAIGDRFEHPSEFGPAYEQVQKLSLQAPLSEETQIVDRPAAAPVFGLSPKQDRALSAHLQDGNADGACRLLDGHVDRMARGGAGVGTYAELARLLLAKIRTLEPSPSEDADDSRLEAFGEAFARCRTAEQFKEVCREAVRYSAERVRGGREEADPVAGLVMNILETRYSQDLSLGYLADLLNMSSAYLSVYIKEKTGANFSEHLNSIRVRKAQELLVSTDKNINDISAEVGYSNFTSFNRMFKKQTGMTPGEYRKRQIAQIHRIG